MMIAFKRLVTSYVNSRIVNWHVIWIILLACRYHGVLVQAREFEPWDDVTRVKK